MIQSIFKLDFFFDFTLPICDYPGQWNQETNSMTITFNPPISPGTTITVGLKPFQNPSVAGTYLFGVTVFPEGAIAQSMYLGVGRLHFYKDYW